jgi:hypothetical protein
MLKRIRKPLNLTLDVKIARRMKIRSFQEGTSLSELTERLYLEYLKGSRERARRQKT